MVEVSCVNKNVTNIIQPLWKRLCRPNKGWIIKQNTAAASLDLQMHSMVLHNYISYLQETKFETRLSVMTEEVLVGEWASE